MSGLELVIGLAVATTVVVFAAAFRYGLRSVRTRDAQQQAVMPRAVVIAGDARWLAGQGRQRWLDRVPTFQAALVAVGITSIFIMGLCLVANVAVVAIGA